MSQPTKRPESPGDGHPCIEPSTRRYRPYPWVECRAVRCVFGARPKGAPGPVVVHPGQRACEHCGTPFGARGRTRSCSETCRHRAMMGRGRHQRAGEAV
jgi:hypothetical protein